MQIVKEYRNNDFFYDNTKNQPIIQKVYLDNGEIEINFNDIIGTQFTGGNLFQRFEQLKSYMNIGSYEKAPCGGFVNFYSVIGKYNDNYIVYSGIKEVSNSHYIITIHKILKDI